MLKKDKFDKAIESLQEKNAAIRMKLSDMKNDLIQSLLEENIRLTKRIETLEFINGGNVTQKSETKRTIIHRTSINKI